MTREEAKEFIAQSIKSDVDMALVADAIKALEQEPTNNYLANCCIDKWEDVDGKKVEAWIVKGKMQIRHRGAIHNFALPSVILQEPTTKNDLGVLDKIRAEIEPKCDRINSLASVLSYTSHREIQELLCEIMDLCKAESEDKE